MEEERYEWIIALAACFAFVSALGIGANDVANAFATSVGAKALKIREAVIIAAVFEFAGAVLLGGFVSNTIREDIANVDCFLDRPVVFMWGMVSVLICSGAWLWVATYFELPVSNTHATVGGIAGMTMVAAGPDCVVWARPTQSFPYITGIVTIAISWVTSPIFSGALAALIYYMARRYILRTEYPFDRGLSAFPPLAFCCVTMVVFYIVLKDPENPGGLGFEQTTPDVYYAIITAVGSGVIAAIVARSLRERLEAIAEEMEYEESEEGGSTRRSADQHASTTDTPTGGTPKGEVPPLVAATVPRKGPTRTDSVGSIPGMKEYMRRKMDTDIDQVISRNSTVSDIHSLAELFAPEAEIAFRFMQVLTASLDAFAHGANDVANAMGPFAAVYYVYTNNFSLEGFSNGVGNNIYWMLAGGGLGIVVGLAMYGYKIMYAIGVKLAKITPSRGFSIELGGLIIVLLGSRLGIPLSSTHCQVGATMGVAAMEGTMASTNWSIVGKTFAGWFLTVGVAGGMSAGVFAAGLTSNAFPSQQVGGGMML